MRYLRLYITFVKNCIIREMMFKGHLILSFLGRIIWFFVFILLYEIIYANIPTLHGWTHDQSLLLLSVFFLIDTCGIMMFGKNISTLPRYICQGDLDGLLTKPADAQFVVSLRYFSLTSVFSLLPPLYLFILQTIKLGIQWDIANTALFIVFFITSLIIYYSIWFITNLILFWAIQVEGLHELFLMFFRFMQFPPDIIQNPIRMAFLTAIPILFTVSVPTEALLHIFNIHDITILLMSALFALILSRILWKIGLKNYTSASS